MRFVDVAVVGGGPGGAAAAKSILRAAPNLSVKLYERAKNLRRMGHVISLQNNGFSALAAIDPLCREMVEAQTLPDGPALLLDENNKESRRLESVFRDSDNNRRMIPWYQLQQGLLEDLPAGIVELGHALEQLTPTADSVELQFRDQSPVQAKVVVGADGNMSQVRRMLLGDGLPNYLGVGVWRGTAPMPPDWPYEAFLSTFAGSQLTRLFFISRLRDGMLAWQAFVPWEAARLAELGDGRYAGDVGGSGSRADRLARCIGALAAAKGQPPPASIMELIKSTDPSLVSEHPQFYREAAACQVWGSGRVTLLGDAAHLFTAALGQGLNQALEDAVELGRAIGEHGPTEVALRQYEQVRIPRATAVHAGSVAMMKEVLAGVPVAPEEWHAKNPWCRQVEIAPLVAPSS